MTTGRGRRKTQGEACGCCSTVGYYLSFGKESLDEKCWMTQLRAHPTAGFLWFSAIISVFYTSLLFLTFCCLTINFLISIFPPSSQTPLLATVPIYFVSHQEAWSKKQRVFHILEQDKNSNPDQITLWTKKYRIYILMSVPNFNA